MSFVIKIVWASVKQVFFIKLLLYCVFINYKCSNLYFFKFYSNFKVIYKHLKCKMFVKTILKTFLLNGQHSSQFQLKLVLPN